ncbi:uncharacterized protein LOC129579717 [Sitodiplosis mosellana]|uniref:uncharacterized protein LOC129579717 n=1 Tax=Sitodiplosis mosellana TaxID=263140 RepID=UPI0024442943|nr:uncharacterized protein LOC129579717 [Sitodiplosis mosellana]
MITLCDKKIAQIKTSFFSLSFSAHCVIGNCRNWNDFLFKMGVNGLTTFVKQQKLYHHIDILEEIRKHRKANGNALIIFDVMGFVHNFGATVVELNLGGRQHIYLHQFEQFLQALQKAGAMLAFFCDGQLQADKNDVWCRRRDADFQAALALINEHSHQDGTKKRFGCKTIVKSLLKMVEDKRYGKVVISTEVDCDKAIAKYAMSKGALAVVASDSDFLIFEGDFQWWDSKSIRMHQMTAKRFERNQLRQKLSLTSEQLKYFATIVGNDHTGHMITKRCDFIKVAHFCQSIDSERCNPQSIYQKIGKYMLFGSSKPIDIESIARSIQSYDANYDIAQCRNPMNDYCSANVLMFAFWHQQVFQYEVNFVDFKPRHEDGKNNNVQLFLDTLIEVFRKLGGILLNGISHTNPMLKIVTKYSLYEKYMLREYTPIYPEGMAEIEDIIFGKNIDDKWNLLLWSIGIDVQLRFDLDSIPKRYVHTVLALIFLLKANEITSLQADALLLCQYNIFEGKFDLESINIDETVVSKEVIRVGQLFSRTITLIWDCFMVCGLSEYIQMDWFDGPYFSYLLVRCQRLKAFHNESLTKIRSYRLYAPQ